MCGKDMALSFPSSDVASHPLTPALPPAPADIQDNSATISLTHSQAALRQAIRSSEALMTSARDVTTALAPLVHDSLSSAVLIPDNIRDATKYTTEEVSGC